MFDAGEFESALEEKAGKDARDAFIDFKRQMLEERGLSEASGYVPPLALRGDLAAAVSLTKYSLKLLSIGTKGTLLTGPFTKIMDRYQVSGRVFIITMSSLCKKQLTNNVGLSTRN